MALIDNIINFYNFEGNSNDDVASRNGTDTSVLYNASYGLIAQGVSFQDNVSGGSVVASDYIGLAPMNIGTGDFSISIWFYVLEIDADQQSLYNEEQNGGAGRPAVKIVFSSSYIQGVVGISGDLGDLTIATTLSINTWYHVVLTRSGINYKLYFNNGTPATSSTTAVINLAITSTAWFGRRYNSTYSTSQTPFKGYMDLVGFWSRTLSALEVSELYNSGAGLAYPFTPPALGRSRGFIF